MAIKLKITKTHKHKVYGELFEGSPLTVTVDKALALIKTKDFEVWDKKNAESLKSIVEVRKKTAKKLLDEKVKKLSDNLKEAKAVLSNAVNKNTVEYKKWQTYKANLERQLKELQGEK